MNALVYADATIRSLRILSISMLFFTFVLGFLASEKSLIGQESQPEKADVGVALDSLFDVRRAPVAKSMGLLRGSFLEAISPQQAIQVAFVIDTTESMQDQISSIRKRLPNMVDDLSRQVDGKIQTAIVTVSDVGKTGGPVESLSPVFMNPENFEKTIAKLKVSSGRPYFYEPIDLGLYTAIENLPWSNDDQVQKWIILLGDAPPYESTFDEPKTKARRFHETVTIKYLANQKKIKIHCLLCKSRARENVAFEKSLDRTRSFMGDISSGTGGLMLDTSSNQIQQLLAVNAKRKRTEYSKVGLISKKDVESMQREITEASTDTEVKRMAVLPLFPLDKLNFQDSREVRVSTELRLLLRKSPLLRLTRPRDVELAINRLKTKGVPEAEWPQALCLRLGVDYVLTGSLSVKQGITTAFVQVHDQNSGAPLINLNFPAELKTLSRVLIKELATVTTAAKSFLPLKSHMAALAKTQAADVAGGGGFLEMDETDRNDLFTAVEAIEQAIDYPLEDPTGLSILEFAEKKLKAILAKNEKQAFVQAMLASCEFNLAKSFEAAGQNNLVQAKMDKCRDAIKKAHYLKKELVDLVAQLEISADFNLLASETPDFPEAIRYYERITSQNQSSPVHHALRAHWMLAGIYSGDWGAKNATPPVQDPAKAKQHLLAILVHWPESIEAKTIKRHLRWDDESGRSGTQYFPREGDLLTKN